MSSDRVNVRRPTLYLLVAGVLALSTLLIPSGGGAVAGPQAEVPPPAGGPAAPSVPCDTVVDSLRPDGPLPAAGTAVSPKLDEIRRNGRLVVGVDQSKYLVGFRDPQTGELQGTDIDIVNRIAEAIFGEPGRVRFVVYDVADRVKAVQSKEVDLVVNTLSITCARQQQIEFSSPYLVAQQRIMVARGSGISGVEGLGDKSICTSAGSTTERVLKELPVATRAEDPMEVVTEANIADCVIRLQAGQVAAVSTDDIILAGLSAQDPQTEVVGGVLDTTDLGIGISKDHPDLVRFVNAVLEQGRADGSLEASYARWLGGQLNPPPVAPAARYRD